MTLNFMWAHKSLMGIEAASEKINNDAELVVLYGALADIGQQIVDVAKREEALIRDGLVKRMAADAQTLVTDEQFRSKIKPKKSKR